MSYGIAWPYAPASSSSYSSSSPSSASASTASAGARSEMRPLLWRDEASLSWPPLEKSYAAAGSSMSSSSKDDSKPPTSAYGGGRCCGTPPGAAATAAPDARTAASYSAITAARHWFASTSVCAAPSSAPEGAAATAATCGKLVTGFALELSAAASSGALLSTFACSAPIATGAMPWDDSGALSAKSLCVGCAVAVASSIATTAARERRAARGSARARFVAGDVKPPPP